MKWTHRLLGFGWVCLVALMWVGCATVPETGRKQFVMLSADEETKLGVTSFDQVKKEVPISHDAQANALLQKVGKRIAAVAQLPGAQWEFVLFESKEANAFCLPGGKVGVYIGILPITQNEAGLATVLGHEVAHAVARHGAERVTDAWLLQTGGSLLEAGLSVSKTDPKWQGALVTAYGVVGTVGVELPFSRAHESEADHIGILYLARAGYDPAEAVKFWERFAEYNRRSGGAQTPVFLRTHPLDETRIKQLQTWMPEAKAQYHSP